MPKVRNDEISIHAAREGGDRFARRKTGNVLRFQSTPPVKAATDARTRTFALAIISIHAAREGGDPIP